MHLEKTTWKFDKTLRDKYPVIYNPNIPLKKFVVSLPNKKDINSFEECENFILKNKDIIQACYIHPPFGGNYSDYKISINFEPTLDNISYTKQQINLLHKYNIPIQATFNNYNLLYNASSDTVCKDIERYSKVYGEPDYILTFDKFAEAVNKSFPTIKLIRTVNDVNFININNPALKYYDTIVLRNNFYNIKLFKELKNRYNTKLEFILLNACVTYCPRKGDRCARAFKLLVEKHGLEYEIAHQMILPSELILFDDYLDYIKIAPDNLQTMQKSLNRYIEQKWTNYDFLAFQAEYIYNAQNRDKVTKEYLDSLNFELNDETYNKIIDIKNELWTEQLQQKIDLNKGILLNAN